MSGTGQQPLVSVVMIFKDALPYFEESINSALAQTYPCELLLCDDGSSDGSTTVARTYAAREPHRVRYLEHPRHANRGMSATRNLGVSSARGEFVAFLDADDRWEPEHLGDDVRLLLEHPEAGLVCGQALVWHSWTASEYPDDWTPLPWPPGTVIPPPRMLSALLRRGSYRTPTCSLLVRRWLLEKVSGAEERFTSIFEDQALLTKLFLAAPAVISASRTARYRQHDGSATAMAQRAGVYAPDRPNRSRDEFLQWLTQVVQDDPHAADDELREALSDAMNAYENRSRLRLAKAKLHLRAALSPAVRRMLRRVDAKVRGGILTRVAFPRRFSPLSRAFGYDRGSPVDRYYIERFLGEHAHLVAGRVLEVGDAHYTRQFGGDKVGSSDVLNVLPDTPGTTFVDDLSDSRSLPSETFDCVILTQTLHLIYDMAAAVETLHRILRPGGAVLATVPGISPVDQGDWRDSWFWALTPSSAQRLFSDVFGEAHVETTSCGNLITCMAFLQGMASHELSTRELSTRDPQFPLLITIKAVRPAGD